MHRQILIGCLPYLGWMLGSIAAAWLLLRLTQTRADWRQLFKLHADQRGAVQSLSFVLTIPPFVMVMMFIVQLSQLTIAKVAVEYSAFTAARSAQVWIPATLGVGSEEENRFSTPIIPLREFKGEDGWNYAVYRVQPRGPKFTKAWFAAVEALMPICPSRDTGADTGAIGNESVGSFERALAQWAPNLQANPKFVDRLRYKLAYALENTGVTIDIYHKEDEPPLQTYLIDGRPEEFTASEIGWNDQIVVTVVHNFALLPGPGRLLARSAPFPSVGGGSYGSGSYRQPSGSAAPADRDRYTPPVAAASTASGDLVSSKIGLRRGTYVYPMTATVRLYNEGEKSKLPYQQMLRGPSIAAVLSYSNSDGSPAMYDPGRSPYRAASGWSPEFQRMIDEQRRSDFEGTSTQDCCAELPRGLPFEMPVDPPFDPSSELPFDSSTPAQSILRRGAAR